MKKISVFFTFLIAVAQSINAQTPLINDELKGIINEGFAYFPSLQELQENTAASESTVDYNNAYRMPVVTGTATYNYVTPIGQATLPVGPNEYQTVKFQPYNNINANVGVNYTILDFGRIKSNVQKSKDQLSYSNHTMDQAKAQLASQIATIYYSIVYIKKAIAVQDTVIAFLNQNKKIVESRVLHGDALKLDLLSIQSTIDMELNRKIELENMLQRNYTLMAYCIGRSNVNPQTAFDFVIENLSSEELLKVTMDNNPEYIMAKDKISISSSDVMISKTLNRPSLSVMGTAGVRNGYMPDISQVRFNYLLGASLNVPIYAGGRYHEQTKIYSHVNRMNEIHLNTLQNNYKRDIGQVMADIEANKNKLTNTESQIAQAKLSQELVSSQYRNGTSTYLDLINTNSNYQRAFLSKLQYEYQLCQNYIELARITGVKYW